MEKVLNYLSEIEDKANKIIEHAEEEKVLLHQELDQRISSLEQSIADENKKKLEVLKKQINQELEKEVQVLKEDSKKQLVDLENYYTSNHDSLVNKVFQNIIGA